MGTYLCAAVTVAHDNLTETMLRRFWNTWKRFGRWMGDQVARVVLTLFYFTIALPFGLGVRLGLDPLGRKSAPAWIHKDAGEATLARAQELY